jgi:ABC-type polysaccharide/polyol phosphate export permease
LLLRPAELSATIWLGLWCYRELFRVLAWRDLFVRYKQAALLAFFASVGPSLWITSLHVKYRDFRYLIPFIVQFGFYVFFADLI